MLSVLNSQKAIKLGPETVSYLKQQTGKRKETAPFVSALSTALKLFQGKKTLKANGTISVNMTAL